MLQAFKPLQVAVFRATGQAQKVAVKCYGHAMGARVILLAHTVGHVAGTENTIQKLDAQ